MTTVSALPLSDEVHRQDFALFVQSAAHEWYKEHLGRLYDQWYDYNLNYFDEQLPQVPYITFGTPGSARTLGQCANISQWGGRLQITLRTSLVDGKYKHLKSGEQYRRGREKFVDDVLLHEMIHQLQMEVLNNSEPAFKGHGPGFAAECNRIGALLGLPPVRPAKARGKHKAMPSCAQWPHCVRPLDYYEGAYDPPGVADAPDEGGDDTPADDVQYLNVPVTMELMSWLTNEVATINTHSPPTPMTPALLASGLLGMAMDRNGVRNVPKVHQPDTDQSVRNAFGLTEREAARLGPRELKEPGSRAWVFQTLNGLRYTWLRRDLAIEEWHETIEELRQHKAWQALGHATLNELLQAEIGRTLDESAVIKKG